MRRLVAAVPASVLAAPSRSVAAAVVSRRALTSSSSFASPFTTFGSNCGSNGSGAASGSLRRLRAAVAAGALGLQRRTVTNEDRRWWIVHLECCPDVSPGTFVSWLDSCGPHTTKKLVERNVWTIEQVAALTSDQVDELRYKEGCLHMDVVWEHARSVLVPLKQREVAGGVESELRDRIAELRKKRELERRREEILSERRDTAQDRERTLQAMREQIAKKKEALRQRQAERQAAQQREDGATAPDMGSGEADDGAAPSHGAGGGGAVGALHRARQALHDEGGDNAPRR